MAALVGLLFLALASGALDFETFPRPLGAPTTTSTWTLNEAAPSPHTTSRFRTKRSYDGFGQPERQEVRAIENLHLPVRR